MNRAALALVLAALPSVAFATGNASGPKAASSSPLGTDAPEVLEGLLAKHYQDSIQLAFGTFTYEYSGLATPFSRYLEDALSSLIASSDDFRLFNRNVASAMDPSFREQYKDFFETNQVEGLLSGRFFIEGANIRVRLELTSLITGNLVGSGDMAIALRGVPSSIAVSPSATSADAAAKLARVLPSSSKDLVVSVSTDRGPGACYEDGERMTVYVMVNKKAYVKVYHIAAGGEIQLIWPNRFGGSSSRLLSPGAPIPIPAPGDPFDFVLGAPYGTEFIKVVASTQPFAQTEEDFASLGSDSGTVLTRGLAVLDAAKAGAGELGDLPQTERSESLASYYIGPPGMAFTP